MNQKKLTYIAIALGLVLLFMTSFIIYYMIINSSKLNERIDAKLSTIQNGKDAEPPTEEYLLSLIRPLIPEPIPGSDGKDGKDSLSTHTVETKTIVEKTIEQVPVNGKDGTNGVDGRSIEIRCNEIKNRWEIRYIDDGSWSIVKDTVNNPVKCVINSIGE